MFTTGLDIDHERVVTDLRAAVAGIEHAFKSPEWSIRVAAMKAALINLDRAVEATRRADLNK